MPVSQSVSWLRFQRPLIKPYVRFSRIRLSEFPLFLRRARYRVEVRREIGIRHLRAPPEPVPLHLFHRLQKRGGRFVRGEIRMPFPANPPRRPAPEPGVPTPAPARTVFGCALCGSVAGRPRSEAGLPSCALVLSHGDGEAVRAVPTTPPQPHPAYARCTAWDISLRPMRKDSACGVKYIEAPMGSLVLRPAGSQPPRLARRAA